VIVSKVQTLSILYNQTLPTESKDSAQSQIQREQQVIEQEKIK